MGHVLIVLIDEVVIRKLSTCVASTQDFTSMGELSGLGVQRLEVVKGKVMVSFNSVSCNIHGFNTTTLLFDIQGDLCTK